jgi:hypothetical protein
VTAAKVWWCSWTHPEKHRESKEIAATWPPGVEGWLSGTGDGYEIWCGRVEAPTRDAAIALVGSMYGSLAKHMRWRFGPDEKPTGWRPGGRFPSRGAS